MEDPPNFDDFMYLRYYQQWLEWLDPYDYSDGKNRLRNLQEAQ